MSVKRNFSDILSATAAKSKRNIDRNKYRSESRRRDKIIKTIGKIIDKEVLKIMADLDNTLMQRAKEGKTDVLFELYREGGNEFDEINRLGGAEFNSKHLREYCDKHGLNLHIFTENTQYINGYVGSIIIMNRFSCSVFALIKW